MQDSTLFLPLLSWFCWYTIYDPDTQVIRVYTYSACPVLNSVQCSTVQYTAWSYKDS